MRLWLEEHPWTEISLASGRHRQIWATRGCQILGKLAAPAVPELLTAATIDGTRSDAMAALASIGEPAVSVLARMLRGQDAALRRWAISILSRIGLPARAAIPELLKILNSPVPVERRMAATAVGMIGSEAETVVPALISLLDDPDLDTRITAAFSLGNFVAKSKDAVPRLTQWLKSSSSDEQHAAKSALQQINSTPPLEPGHRR